MSQLEAPRSYERHAPRGERDGPRNRLCAESSKRAHQPACRWRLVARPWTQQRVAAPVHRRDQVQPGPSAFHRPGSRRVTRTCLLRLRCSSGNNHARVHGPEAAGFKIRLNRKNRDTDRGLAFRPGTLPHPIGYPSRPSPGCARLSGRLRSGSRYSSSRCS
jgi:hypothetical protein